MCEFIGEIEGGVSTQVHMIVPLLVFLMPETNFQSRYLCYFGKQTVPSASSVSTKDLVHFEDSPKIIYVNGSNLCTLPQGNCSEPASNCHQPHVCFKGTVDDC